MSGRNPRDHAQHPHHVPGDAATDSSGLPWQQRELSPTGFESDTGAADPALVDALAADAPDLELMRALEAARLIVPVVAEAAPGPDDGGGAGDGGGVDGGHVEKVPRADPHVDMAAVTLVAPDGQRALPVFTGVASLAAWDPQARPVPVTPARAGQAAASEGCDVVVIDVAGPHQRVLRPSMLWALAQQRPWRPAHDDPFVDRSVAAAVATEDRVTAYELEEGTPHGTGTLGIALTLVPGLAPEEVRALATRVGERLATDGELRARIDGLAFRLR